MTFWLERVSTLLESHSVKNMDLTNCVMFEEFPTTLRRRILCNSLNASDIEAKRHLIFTSCEISHKLNIVPDLSK